MPDNHRIAFNLRRKHEKFKSPDQQGFQQDILQGRK